MVLRLVTGLEPSHGEPHTMRQAMVTPLGPGPASNTPYSSIPRKQKLKDPKIVRIEIHALLFS